MTPDFSNGIAFHHQSGHAPGIVFLHGFKSDMLGTKAEMLAQFCTLRGQAYLRFDCRAHGQSAGDFADFTIGGALADTLHMLDDHTDGPQILVGSSMGGWLAMLAALARPEKVFAIVGLAPAPDFTDQIYQNDLNDNQRAELLAAGQTHMPSDYGDPHLITQKLITDGRQYFVMQRLGEIKCPLRILHGQRDADVDWRQSLDIQQRWGSDDCAVTLLKDSDHRLSSDADLAALRDVITQLLGRG